jgi:hypothetical protein
MKDILHSNIMPVMVGGIAFAIVFLAGMTLAFNFEEPVMHYAQEDLNRDGVVDLADFSISVDTLGKIMDELGADSAPCTTCEDLVFEVLATSTDTLPYEAEFSPVPLPYEGVVTGVTVTAEVE